MKNKDSAGDMNPPRICAWRKFPPGSAKPRLRRRLVRTLSNNPMLIFIAFFKDIRNGPRPKREVLELFFVEGLEFSNGVTPRQRSLSSRQSRRQRSKRRWIERLRGINSAEKSKPLADFEASHQYSWRRPVRVCQAHLSCRRRGDSGAVRYRVM